MSEFERVVLRTRKLETLLRVRYHAEGEGLHQLITSCEDRLPHDVIAKLRYVATIKNKLVHDEENSSDAIKDFFEVCEQCEQELTPRSGRFIWRVAIMLMMLMTLAALAFYYANWDILSKHLL
ncbi:DUF4145 domain-containing protein [Vibrio sp.]|uniref:DUF4145 domain-containing protein n=1 Tax=Vibrio sp. TaxID=678 RepID=UPI003D0F43FF